MNKHLESVHEPARETSVGQSVDVLVAGMGPAGIAAGVAAAREGARTLVIERFGYPGGMITGAHVVAVLGVGDGRRTLARGITREIRERLEPLDAVSRPNPSGDYSVDAEVFKWQALEMLKESGSQFLLHTLACDPIMEDGAVRGVFVENKTGRRAIRAKVVVDCTADADLAYRAGCACDNETHDVTLRVVVEGVDRAAAAAFEKENPERYQAVLDEALRMNGGVTPDRPRYVKGIDTANAEALSRAEFEIRRDCFRALYHLRQNMPGWAAARVRETSPQIGVRQSRRVRGLYCVTDDDLRASRRFDDSIARLGSYLAGYKLYDPAGLDYDLPYRCLVPESVEGLLLAGRCCSCDYAACNTLRLIVPCLATGQAAGAAAALAARADVHPREVSIPDLQDALRRQDVHLGEARPTGSTDSDQA